MISKLFFNSRIEFVQMSTETHLIINYLSFKVLCLIPSIFSRSHSSTHARKQFIRRYVGASLPSRGCVWLNFITGQRGVDNCAIGAIKRGRQWTIYNIRITSNGRLISNASRNFQTHNGRLRKAISRVIATERHRSLHPSRWIDVLVGSTNFSVERFKSL